MNNGIKIAHHLRGKSEMNLKEKFLSIKEYKEYDAKREAFKRLDFTDPEISNHYTELLLSTGVHRSNPFMVDGVHTDGVDFSKIKS